MITVTVSIYDILFVRFLLCFMMSDLLFIALIRTKNILFLILTITELKLSSDV